MENKITFNGVDSKKSNTKKENIKKIIIRIVNIFCYIATIFLAILLIVSFTYKPNKSNVSIPHLLNRKVDNIQLVEDNLSNVISIDGQVITIEYTELNNYKFSNLANYFNQNSSSTFSDLNDYPITYGSNSYSFDEFVVNDSITFFYNSIPLDLNLYSNGEDFGKWSVNNVYGEFENDLEWDLTGSVYATDIVNAIQLDIELNTNPNISIFEGITSSITSFTSTLNSGITAIIGIFWANNSLTPIGILTTIVVGVSIVYFIFSLVIGLIRLRG